MSIIITTPTHRDMLNKIRGTPIRSNQTHRNRWREAKNGDRKHKGEWT